MDEFHDAVGFLAASETRAALLLRLRREGPKARRACYDWFDASRRTVKRALAALEERAWIRERDGRYGATALGTAVADRYERLAEELGLAHRLAPVLARVPAGEFDVDLGHFADAEVVSASEETPVAPLDRVLEIRRRASRLREVSTIVVRESASQVGERIKRGEADVEVVVTADAVERAASNPDYRELLRDAQAAEDVLFVTAEPVPFLIAVADDTVVLGVTDDDGMVSAAVVCEAPPVREWAEARFDALRADAVPLADWSGGVDLDSG